MDKPLIHENLSKILGQIFYWGNNKILLILDDIRGGSEFLIIKILYTFRYCVIAGALTPWGKKGTATARTYFKRGIGQFVQGKEFKNDQNILKRTHLFVCGPKISRHRFLVETLPPLLLLLLLLLPSGSWVDRQNDWKII